MGRGIQQLARVPIVSGELRRFVDSEDIFMMILSVYEDSVWNISGIKTKEKVETYVRYMMNGDIQSGPIDVIERYTRPVQ